jgi:hypothetical protein
VLEASSFLYGLIELLHEKGLITIEELESRQKVVAARLEEQLRQNGAAVMLQEPETDKYAWTTVVEIDCGSRVPLCRAACCKLPFALSREDIREGVIHWDLGHPYVIAHGPDGYCEHMDRGDCAVASAPVAFRVRVWEVMSRGRGPRGKCPPPEGVDVACPPGDASYNRK